MINFVAYTLGIFVLGIIVGVEFESYIRRNDE